MPLLEPYHWFMNVVSSSKLEDAELVQNVEREEMATT